MVVFCLCTSVHREVYYVAPRPVNRQAEPCTVSEPPGTREGDLQGTLGVNTSPLAPRCSYSGAGHREALCICLLYLKTPPDNSWLLCSQGGRTSCREREPPWQPLEKSLSPVTDNVKSEDQQSLKLQHPPAGQAPTWFFNILKAWRWSRAK